MKELVVGGILGAFVFLATRGCKSGAIRATPRHPASTLPPHLATSTIATDFAPRGLPFDLAEALLKAPTRPNPSADNPADTVTLVLSDTKTHELSEKVVGMVNAVSKCPLHLVMGDAAMNMSSGVTRVIFTAHYPKRNVSVKLVAIVSGGELLYIRPYSQSPELEDPLTTTDPRAPFFACFPPVVSPGPCTN